MAPLLVAKLGTVDLAPLRVDRTMSEPKDGPPVFMNTSIFWASVLQAFIWKMGNVITFNMHFMLNLQFTS